MIIAITPGISLANARSGIKIKIKIKIKSKSKNSLTRPPAVNGHPHLDMDQEMSKLPRESYGIDER